MTTSKPCIDKLFRNARTHSAWTDKRVSDETLRELYDALKWGPTSANASPARFVFIRSAAAKERLRPSLAPGNVEKTMTAPVTVIVAYDLQFHEKLPNLFPHNPAMRDLFASNASLIEVTARRNSSLQGAYLMLAARALGLDCGPMSGFDNAKLDEEFFGAGKECEGCEQEFFPRRSREVQFSVQSRLRRSVKALFAQSASRIQRGVHIDVGLGRGVLRHAT